jgi:hypothetical protein
MALKQRQRVLFITYAGVLLAIASLFPALHLPQYVTGPIVNLTLIIATYVLGVVGGVTIGCLTPWIAFMAGLMPFLPLVPFIMIGNAIYALSFGLLKRLGAVGMIIGIVVGSCMKYLFLAYSVRYLVQAPPKLVEMMSVPQLLTAGIGGIIALLVIKTGYLKENILIER